jgi:hypothetical protein
VRCEWARDRTCPEERHHRRPRTCKPVRRSCCPRAPGAQNTVPGGVPYRRLVDVLRGVGADAVRLPRDPSFVVVVAHSGTSGSAPTGARTVDLSRSREAALRESASSSRVAQPAVGGGRPVGDLCARGGCEAAPERAICAGSGTPRRVRGYCTIRHLYPLSYGTSVPSLGPMIQGEGVEYRGIVQVARG